MEVMRELVAAACFIALALSAAETICPDKKFDKQLKTVFAMLFMAAVAAPLLSGKVSFEFPDISSVPTDISYAVERTDEEALCTIGESVGESVKQKLSEKELLIEEIFVSVNISDEDGIFISEISYVPTDESSRGEIDAELKALFGESILISGGGTDV